MSSRPFDIRGDEHHFFVGPSTSNSGARLGKQRLWPDREDNRACTGMTGGRAKETYLSAARQSESGQYQDQLETMCKSRAHGEATFLRSRPSHQIQGGGMWEYGDGHHMRQGGYEGTNEARARSLQNRATSMNRPQTSKALLNRMRYPLKAIGKKTSRATRTASKRIPYRGKGGGARMKKERPANIKPNNTRGVISCWLAWARCTQNCKD